jgi:Cu-Zn family superoxide dismutase
MTVRPSQLLACAIAVSVAGLVLVACTINTPVMAAIAPATGTQAFAQLVPKNGSVTYGTVLFTQRGDKVAVLAQVFNLSGGPHSFYIHETGNCSSLNAASAGPVWNVKDAPPGARRSGDLPNIVVRQEASATLVAQVTGLSVGTGAANDVTGHSVVVHGKLDPDPKPEFGVINDWLACGVIEKF